MENVPVVLVLAITVKVVFDYFVAPFRDARPNANFWWFIYVAGGVGFAVGWVANVNAFGEYVDNETLGRVLTSFLVAGGSNLVHDLLEQVKGTGANP